MNTTPDVAEGGANLRPLFLSRVAERTIDANSPEIRNSPYRGTALSVRVRIIGQSAYNEVVRASNTMVDGERRFDTKAQFVGILKRAVIEWSGIQSVGSDGRPVVVSPNEEAFAWLAEEHQTLAAILVHAATGGTIIDPTEIRAEAGN